MESDQNSKKNSKFVRRTWMSVVQTAGLGFLVGLILSWANHHVQKYQPVPRELGFATDSVTRDPASSRSTGRSSKPGAPAVLPDDGIPYEFSTSGDVVFTGDIHGDLDALVAVLQHSKLIDKDGHWIGGNSIFYQVGDLIDMHRGDSAALITYYRQLEREAQSAGGHAIISYGNMELEDLEQDGSSIHTDISPGSSQGLWLRSSNTAVVITQELKNGFKRFIGVHAGLSRLAMRTSFGEFNATTRAWMKYWQYKARTELLLESRLAEIKTAKYEGYFEKKEFKKLKHEAEDALEKLKTDALPLIDEEGAAVTMPPKSTAWVIGYNPVKHKFDRAAPDSPVWARFNKVTLGKNGEVLPTEDPEMLTPDELKQLLAQNQASFIALGHAPNPKKKKLGIPRMIRFNPKYEDNTVLLLDTRNGFPQQNGRITYARLSGGELSLVQNVPRPAPGGRVARDLAARLKFGTATCKAFILQELAK